MANLVPLTPIRPIVDENGTMTQETHEWTQAVTRFDTMVGTGSPEGVVSALQTQRYMDLAGTANNIVYIKRDADVAGDTTLGWILT